LSFCDQYVSNTYLITQQENEVDDIRSKLQMLMTEKENSQLVNNSLMQQQQKMLERVRIESKVVESGTEKETEGQKDSIRDMAEVVQGIRNLYVRCQASTERKAKISFSKDNSNLLETLAIQLDVILSRCRDLIEITSEYSSFQARESVALAEGETRGGGSMSTMQTAAALSGVNKSEKSITSLK